MNVKRIRVSHWAASLACLGLASFSWIKTASAEITLLEKDGWQIFTEGRVGAFGSVAFGQDVPSPVSPDPAFPARPLLVGTFGSDNEQTDLSGNTLAFRLRSGMMPNILAFGFRKELSETTTVRGYISLWASADTNRVKYTKSAFDVRQGFLELEGNWGSLLAGRALALFARGNWEIDYLYQHGYGFGHPCKIDSSGEEAGFTGGGTCGQIGFGVLHPGYDAGIAYATPSLGGLKVTLGVYDPVGSQQVLPRTPYPRPEGEVAFQKKLGDLGLIRVFASGMWQRSQMVVVSTDPTTMMMSDVLIDRDAYGFAGGARLELGPLRIGGSGFRGKGLGTHFALNLRNDPTTLHRSQQGGSCNGPNDCRYRTTDGFHGAIAGVFGRLMINAGFGMTRIYRLAEDSVHVDPNDMSDPSPWVVPRYQYGVSAGINVRLSESLVFDIDYFRAHSAWYDDADMNRVIPGQTQDMNVLSSGLVLVW